MSRRNFNKCMSHNKIINLKLTVSRDARAPSKTSDSRCRRLYAPQSLKSFNARKNSHKTLYTCNTHAQAHRHNFAHVLTATKTHVWFIIHYCITPVLTARRLQPLRVLSDNFLKPRPSACLSHVGWFQVLFRFCFI